MANTRSRGKAKVGENVAEPPQIRIEGGVEDMHSDSLIVTNPEPNGNDRQWEEALVQRELDGGVYRTRYERHFLSMIHQQNGGVDVMLEEVLAELGRMR